MVLFVVSFNTTKVEDCLILPYLKGSCTLKRNREGRSRDFSERFDRFVLRTWVSQL